MFFLRTSRLIFFFSYNFQGKLPKNTIQATPENLWWGDKDGTNYLSWTVDQHNPHFCSSCWAQSALSSLADRVNIPKNNSFPRTSFSVQQILNCQPGGDSCKGGHLSTPYKFGKTYYLVEFGCQIYLAKDPATPNCDAFNNCMTCHPGQKKLTPGTCNAIDNNNKWTVDEYGSVKGSAEMKKEIFARGPITCGMFVTPGFKKYNGGVYEESGFDKSGVNHVISVTGWGVDKITGISFWVVRNSWGTSWGEEGFFKIRADKNNLGIGENSCYWATASIMKK